MKPKVENTTTSQQQQVTINPCCCCSLRTGSIIIAILEIIGGIASAARLAFILVRGQPHLLSEMVKEGVEEKHFEGEMDKPFSTTSIVVLSIGIGIQALLIIFGFLLLNAILNKKANFLGVWVAFRCITLVAALVLAIASYILSDIQSGSSLATFVVAVIITLWFVSVVFFYGEEIRDDEKRTRGTSRAGASAVYRAPNSALVV